MRPLHPRRAASGALSALTCSVAAAASAPALPVQDEAPLHAGTYVPAADPDALGAPVSGMDAALRAAIEAQDAADLARAAAAPRLAAPEEPAGPSAAPGAPQVRRTLERVLVDDRSAEGEVWAVGADWKARFAGDGLTYVPRFGRLAPTNYPVRFELEAVSVGGAPLALARPTVRAAEGRVTLERGALAEVYHLALEELEQTFVFETLPGAGDLVLDVAVDSALAVVPGEEALRFVHETFGEVTYGRAFAVDAAGARIEIPRVWNGQGVTLTVPAAFLAGAALPLTVDPLLGTQLTNGYGTTDDDDLPDAAFDAASGKHWVVWRDYVSATDTDCYVTSLNGANTQGSTILIDISTDFWDTPSIATSLATHTALVVASVTTDGPGTSVANVVGRQLDTQTGAPVAATFTIDQSAYDCVNPDVGGSRSTSTSLADFCVVFERQISPTNGDILARLVNGDGTFLTSMTSITTSTADDDRAPAVSKSRGDETLIGDYWNVAWIRDTDHDGMGTPYFNRIYLDGSTTSTTGDAAFATNLASDVDVSSTYDRSVPGTSHRPFVVVYERLVGNGDLYATTCIQTGALETRSLSALEDYDASLDAGRPRIANTGNGFVVVFEERSPNAFLGRQVYALAGSVAYSQGLAHVALSERHVPVAVTAGVQQRPVVASEWDGGWPNDDVLIVWEDSFGAQVSTLTMQRFDNPALQGSVDEAIGRQYCEANAHADSGDSGRRSSFISAFGGGSVHQALYLHCTEMKLDAFAYFIVSNTTANVNLAGGGQGRLCLGGTIGRRVGGNILHSGALGAVQTLVDPLLLPTPNGFFSAAPGDTLYFQCWHRDLVGNVATSNFSNACAITFLP